jgi:hypothetical protein
MTKNEHFIEVAHWQHRKHGQSVNGDVFLSHRIKEEARVITVLSDGLGSGVKANVLASLTATMAAKYIENYTDIKRTAEVIMDTLPVCSVRKISYSTFTIVDVSASGHLRVIEHGNPPYLLLRGCRAIQVPKQVVTLEKWQDREVFFSEFDACVGDRLAFFSDGVTQAAMGSPSWPLGWGVESVQAFVGEQILRQEAVSAGQLARAVADRARELDDNVPTDDITSAVIYIRQPRRLLLVTGPPFAREHDRDLAEIVQAFPGRKVICGGTTASIVARELNRKVVMSLDGPVDPEVPPVSKMQGTDLITEGTLTLSRVADLLEKMNNGDGLPCNAATQLASELLDSDLIEFVVGTRINEAHQDPNIPIELETRRNLVARIQRVLEEKYLKETRRRYQ